MFIANVGGKGKPPGSAPPSRVALAECPVVVVQAKKVAAGLCVGPRGPPVPSRFGDCDARGRLSPGEGQGVHWPEETRSPHFALIFVLCSPFS